MSINITNNKQAIQLTTPCHIPQRKQKNIKGTIKIKQLLNMFILIKEYETTKIKKDKQIFLSIPIFFATITPPNK